MRERGPRHPPGRSHRHVKPTARNPTVQGTVWVMRLDENLSIWSQMGQGNLSRRVPDLKNARGVVKNEGVQVWAPFVRKGGV